jgi:spore coat polysaccharide biosynthesis predicted glycosyltransferase SpsG
MSISTVLLFRADGGPSIGGGHLMRCLALAQELRRQGAACHLATCRPDAAAAWAGDGFAVTALPGAIAGESELAATATLAGRLGAAWLVCDSYALSAPEHARLKGGGRRLACWDDLGDRPLDCDLVINHNVGAQVLAYPCPALQGPHYATLRAAIRGLRRGGGGGVVITFGAAAPAELGLAAGHAVVTACPGVPVHLVGAPAGRSGLPAGVHAYPVGPALAPLMAEAELLLCAGGVTLLEAAFLGVPMVVLPLADNQWPGSRAMAAAGAACLAEDSVDAAATIARLMGDPATRAAMAAAGRRLVDGMGAERIARRLMEESR